MTVIEVFGGLIGRTCTVQAGLVTAKKITEEDRCLLTMPWQCPRGMRPVIKVQWTYSDEKLLLIERNIRNRRKIKGEMKSALAFDRDF